MRSSSKRLKYECGGRTDIGVFMRTESPEKAGNRRLIGFKQQLNHPLNKRTYPDHGQECLQIGDQTTHLALGSDLIDGDMCMDGSSFRKGLDLQRKVSIMLIDDLKGQQSMKQNESTHSISKRSHQSYQSQRMHSLCGPFGSKKEGKEKGRERAKDRLCKERMTEVREAIYR